MKKLYLEFIRGFAAIIVLLYHCVELHPTGKGPKHFYFSNWGTDAVIIFFILSGLVINMSHSLNPKTRREFIINRLLRIYPQLVIGISFGLIVMLITLTTMPNIWVIIGNFTMLSALKDYQNNIVPCIDSNGPIWSLSFEMFFYIVFAITMGRFRKKLLLGWFLVSLLIFPLYYSQYSVGALGHVFALLAFSCIWLMGYYVYEYRNYFYVDKYTALFSAGALPLISRLHVSTIYYDPAKYLLFAVFAIPFFRYCLQLPKAGKKISLYYLIPPYLFIVYAVFTQPYLTFTNWVLYSALPVMLMTACLMAHLLNIKERCVKLINNTGKTLGKYSYSIYIIHYPILFLFAHLIQSPALYVLVSLPCVGIAAYSLEAYAQPAAIRYYKKLKAYLATVQWIGIEKMAKVQ